DVLVDRALDVETGGRRERREQAAEGVLGPAAVVEIDRDLRGLLRVAGDQQAVGHEEVMGPGRIEFLSVGTTAPTPGEEQRRGEGEGEDRVEAHTTPWLDEADGRDGMRQPGRDLNGRSRRRPRSPAPWREW